MTDTNTKLRAVFLAAIMFMWLFAGTVAFAGSAVAQPDDADNTWNSGGSAWQGQQVWFEANDTGSYELREHHPDINDGGAFIDEYDLQDGENVTIDTTDLEGRYVLLNPDGDVVETDEGVEVDSGGPENNVEIRLQSLTTSFTDAQVELNDNATLAISSNRATDFNFVVTSDNLSQSELQTAFQYAEVDDVVDEGDDAVVLEGVNRANDLTVHFDDADVEEGQQITFDFDVADTTSSDSASITVGEEVVGDAQFAEAVFSEERGDIADIVIDIEEELEDNLNLTIGTEDIGYEVTVELDVEEDADTVVVTMNTWQAGQDTGAANESDVFDAEGAEIAEVYRTHPEDGENLTRVLDTGLYDMELVSAADADQEFDVSAVELLEPSLDDITSWTAPRGQFGALTSVGAIGAAAEDGAATETDTIAMQDVVVQQVDVSGVEGYMAQADSPAEGLIDADEAGLITFEMEQTNPSANRNPKILNLSATADNDGLHVIDDTTNNTLFVVVRSDRAAFQRGGTGAFVQAADGDEFETTYELSTDYLDNFLRETNRPAEEPASVSNDIEVVERAGMFDTEEVEGENVVLVPPEEGAEITGETTVAPGTELRIRARATAPSPFLLSQRTTVDDDRTFTAEFDFSGIEEGQDFDASIPAAGFDGDALTAGLVGTVEEETPTPTPEDDDETPTPTPEEEDDDPTPTPEEEDDDPPEDDTDDQAGFGAVVALIALLAAALIAARRHSFDN